MSEVRIKIINHKVKFSSIKKSIPVDVNVKALSEIPKKNAALIINSLDGQKWFIEPLVGRAYLSYPLSTNVEVDIDNINNIGELLWVLSQAYLKIYAEEEKTSTEKATPKEERTGCINRNSTNGEYGIFGHDISDLVFEQISIDKNNLIRVSVGS